MQILSYHGCPEFLEASFPEIIAIIFYSNNMDTPPNLLNFILRSFLHIYILIIQDIELRLRIFFSFTK